MTLLNDAEIQDGIAGLNGWTRQGNAIRRTFAFDTFPDAIRFVLRVADLAEGADHHPDIDIRYSRVTLALSTHSSGGITRKDVDLASRLDAIA